jgi:hypothetical protein
MGQKSYERKLIKGAVNLKGCQMHLSELFPQEKTRNLPPSDWRHRMVSDNRAEAEEMRGCVNRLLDFAEGQGILDPEMLSRLGSEDYDQFLSAIHELAVGEFLDSLGKIDWYPPGRDSKKGEFRIIPANHEPIFVEVKTIFTSSDERRRDRNWDVLREVAHSLPSPFRIDVEFTKLEGDIIPRHFRSWLQRQIRYMKKNLTQPRQEQELIFSDTSADGSVTEAKVAFVRIQDDDLTITACDMTSFGNTSNLPERIRQTIDDALEKLPDNQPTLVVIAGEPWVGLDEIEMIAAMFSYTKVAYKFYKGPAPITPEAPTIYHSLEGIVQQSIRTRLSAVGVWHHKWTKDPEGTLEIYHNPLAAIQIPYHVMESLNVCQLIPKDKDTMEWMPNRPQH